MLRGSKKPIRIMDEMMKEKKRGAVKELPKPSNKKTENKQVSDLPNIDTQMEVIGAFLVEAANKKKPFAFLVEMHQRFHMECKPLTEKQYAAVLKCMEREKQWSKERDTKAKQQESGEYPIITLKVRPFLMKAMQIDSRIITGKLKAETAKAWLIEGHADMLLNMSWCVRCGKQLTEPASQVTGMGKVCAEKMGVPYDSKDILSMNKRQRDKIRKQYQEKLRNQTFERWIPKSGAEVYQE